MLEEQRSKFQKYLRLIFKDLCAKDNGFTLKYFTLPTFLRVRHTSPFMPKSPLSFKYTRSSNISLILVKRLFEVMTNASKPGESAP